MTSRPIELDLDVRVKSVCCRCSWLWKHGLNFEDNRWREGINGINGILHVLEPTTPTSSIVYGICWVTLLSVFSFAKARARGLMLLLEEFVDYNKIFTIMIGDHTRG